MDDNGLGTHVAGIIASSDSAYRGVAPDAKLAAMKVCNAGVPREDADVLAGFDWCIDNAEAYNISVISISLGGGSYTFLVMKLRFCGLFAGDSQRRRQEYQRGRG